MSKVSQFLDARVLPWPVKFLTNRFIILATIALLVPLIVFSAKTVFVLAVNSYLNTMSVAVSSIVLLYATISEVHQQQIAVLQEKRAQEDHTHVVEMHTLMQQTLIAQQKEIDDLKQMLSAIQGKDYTPRTASAPIDLQNLHPRGKSRFEKQDASRRFANNLHHHSTTENVRKKIIKG